MQAKEKQANEMGFLRLTRLTASKSRKMAGTAGLRQLESPVAIVILFKSLSKPSRVVRGWPCKFWKSSSFSVKFLRGLFRLAVHS